MGAESRDDVRTEWTQEQKDRLVDAILYGVDDDGNPNVPSLPAWEDDPIARHFGWVEGVEGCPVGEVCGEHGWRRPADV